MDQVTERYEFVYATRILDNDDKGKNGRGTVRFGEAIVNGTVIESWNYSLLEQVNGFDLDAKLKPYRDRASAWRQYESKMSEEDRKNQAKSRVENIKLDPAVIELITNVMAKFPDMVKQYQEGREKVLNSLVGKCIVEAKSVGVPLDAFVASNVLVKKMKEA